MKDYNTPAILQQQAITIMEHVEDIVEHICDELEQATGKNVPELVDTTGS